ncbi:MAG: ABC transporter permease [Pararhodobacter sp.]|nr:ABC transporter permease [Pararhodobacter sp.]
MLSNRRRQSSLITGFTILELIFHAAVRSIRKSHGNAIIGLMINIAQTLVLVAVFYLMFLIIGMGARGIRGDFLLYVMTGIFLFMCHVKAMSAVVQSEGPTSPMMKHAPMNTIVSIGAAALGELYIQILSMLVVLFLYHAIWQPLEVYDPLGALLMLLLSWFSGVAIGMIFLALKPWAPALVPLLSQIYMRANMVASGKMFVANALPGFMLVYFDWNPLFHTIDQARGFAFLNYTPHYTSIVYPVVISLAALVLGLMGEFYTRKRASISWGARH